MSAVNHDLPLGETADSVNEVATVGEFGFLRVEGPLDYVKTGTVWAVVIPTDEGQGANDYSRAALKESSGECAVAVADGEIVAGGIVEDCEEINEHDELHLVVDQYAMGDAE